MPESDFNLPPDAEARLEMLESETNEQPQPEPQSGN